MDRASCVDYRLRLNSFGSYKDLRTILLDLNTDLMIADTEMCRPIIFSKALSQSFKGKGSV